MLQPPSMFTAPTDLPEDPATLQAILHAALTEIERLQLLIARAAAQSVRPPVRNARRNGGATRNRRPGTVPGREDGRTARRDPTTAACGEDQPTAGEPAKRNRGALPLHLPRVEVIIDIEHKACACCGGSLHLIGEDQAEMLDYIPAQLRVRVIRRPRYGCRACENAIVQAAAPDRPSRLTALAWHQSASRPDRWRHGHGSTGGASADRQVQRPPCATNTSTAMEVWNCVRDEGWPLGIRDQERVPNHRELLS
jgi:hypothetical protein